MDIDARIKRRRRRNYGPRLILDYDVLSPATHVDEPSDRPQVFERLLDHLDPVFDGNLPPNGYVYGPFGAGKSALVLALFAHLDRLSTDNRSTIHTSTRAAVPTTPRFVYVDMREATSEFAFYHAVLDALVEESVPEHGVSTGELRDRLRAIIGESRTGAVVAVDHVGAPDSTDTGDLIEHFAGLPSNVSWLAVGRQKPDDTRLSKYTGGSIRVQPYQTQMLVDVLMTRASEGLSQQAFDHDLARRIADWADGNAHDALAALFIAADRANRDGRTQLTTDDVSGAMADVPRPSVSLGRVLALPDNKQLVLRELVELDEEDLTSVSATTEVISGRPGVDLSQGTVKRFLYEMAEDGIVERVRSEGGSGRGRPPSRIELRFPADAFRRLYDLEH